MQSFQAHFFALNISKHSFLSIFPRVSNKLGPTHPSYQFFLTGCNITVKAEYLNPGGSVKDRAALYLLKDAEEKGFAI